MFNPSCSCSTAVAELRPLLLLFLVATGVQAQMQPNLAVSIEKDSAGVGEPMEWLLTSDEPLQGGKKWDWPRLAVGDSLQHGWEIIDLSPLDSSASPIMDAGLRRTQSVVVMAWDTGFKKVPPFSLTDTSGIAASTSSYEVAIGLAPLEENPTPRPMQGFQTYHWTWWERLQQILPWLLSAALLFWGARWGWLKWKDRQTVEEKEETETLLHDPAHVVALRMLRALEKDAPWNRGEGKEAQTILSEAIRLHLQGTFGVKALERTTDELTRTLNQSPVQGLPQEEAVWVLSILQRSDLVKFAKQNMDGDAHLRVIRESMVWIERTRPMEDVDAPHEEMKGDVPKTHEGE